MRPVKRSDTPGTYVGEHKEGDRVVNKGVGDLPYKIEDGAVTSYWKPSDQELEILNAGGLVELGVSASPLPPVRVNVEPALGDEEVLG
jgi:hypothetical protein